MVTARTLAARDGMLCYLCGVSIVLTEVGDFAPSIDHIVPLARGGSSQAFNLRLAHSICNQAKSDHIDPDVIVAAIIQMHMTRVACEHGGMKAKYRRLRDAAIRTMLPGSPELTARLLAIKAEAFA